MNKLILFLLLFTFSCNSEWKQDSDDFKNALHNGRLANEGFTRCTNYVNDWLEYADPVSGLIPRNLFNMRDIWNPQDAAADNYPFMVLTAFVLDQDLFNGRMHDMLEAEQRLTNRIGRLPDWYSFSKQNFANEEVHMDGILFGASEYIKDGLLPLTEYLGHSAWSVRMTGMLDDLWEQAAYETPFGFIPSLDVEVNGEQLQVLSRLYCMTGDEKYLEWALRLGDYYLLGENHVTRDQNLLRLRDHGCEIVSGLCELYAVTAFKRPDRKEQYREPVYEMLNRILEVGINENGLFYNRLNPVTGEIIDDAIADTWGYTYNAYYTVYLVDGYTPYRDALLKVFNNLNNYRGYNWENLSADGYADAIESALNLYNREPVHYVADWIDSEIQIMWSMQDSAYRRGPLNFDGNGIIEGWHGDGNFARTTMMYCFWKTEGVTLHPWNEKLIYGADLHEGVLRLAISADEDWSGEIRFDTPRHKEIFNLPLDYPRINQFPEWFTAGENRIYEMVNLTRKERTTLSSAEMRDGYEISISKGEIIYLKIKEI